MKKLIYILIASVLVISSCSKDNFDNIGLENTLPDGMARINLSFTLPEAGIVQTRSATTDKEANFQDGVIALFDGQIGETTISSTAKLIRVTPINDIKLENGGYKATIILQDRLLPTWGVAFVNISSRELINQFNAMTTVINETPEKQATTYSEFLNIYETTNIFYPANNRGNYAQLVSGSLNATAEPVFFEKLQGDNTLPNASFHRTYSKINVDASSVTANFSLTGVRLVNGAKKMLINYNVPLTAFTGNDAVEYDVFTASTNSTSNISHPIYLGTNKGTVATNGDNATYLIVRGRYKGIDGFHKIVVRYKNSVTDTDYTYDIKRNVHYTVNITKVNRAGYATYAEAKAAMFDNDDIEYDITVDGENAYDTESNGKYYISASNSEFIVYAKSTLNDVVATTFKYSKSDQATDVDLSTLPKSVTATTGITVSPITWTEDSDIDLTISLNSSITTGTITIRVGNVAKTIKVTRKPTLNAYGGVNSDFGGISSEYLSAEFIGSRPDWIAAGTTETNLSRDNKVYATDNGIYLKSTIHLIDAGSATRSVQLFLSRNSNAGRTRVYLSQNNIGTAQWATTVGDDSRTAGTRVKGYIGGSEIPGAPYMGKQITYNLMMDPNGNRRLGADGYPAAKACWSLNLFTPTSFDDTNFEWYLPAQNQLMAMWVTVNGTVGTTSVSLPDGQQAQQEVGNFGGEWQEYNAAGVQEAGGGIWRLSKQLELGNKDSFTTNAYWSATESYSINSSWYVNFLKGNTDYPLYAKTHWRPVRCVRDL